MGGEWWVGGGGWDSGFVCRLEEVGIIGIVGIVERGRCCG